MTVSKKQNMIKNRKKTGGFSLIELAILSLVVGLVLSSVIQNYNNYSRKRNLEDTEARLNEISSAVMLYLAENNEYPCPSIPGLLQSDPGYGHGFCPSGTLALDTCTAEGFCRARGARDVGGAVTWNNSDPDEANHFWEVAPDGDDENDAVLIGGVPFKDMNISLNLSTQDTSDGWGRQFTYVVTEALTDQATYDERLGTISVQAQSGAELTTPSGAKNVVIMTHGKDGKGAYSSDGRLIAPCAGVARDVENCDGDATFTVMTDGTRFHLADNADYYDDIVIHLLWKTSSLWTQSSTDPDDIYNRNTGNIGIGVEDPTEKMDVDGNVLVDKGRADQFCDVNGNNCFDPQIIAGSGISCGSNRAMVGIVNNDVVCADLALTGVLPNQNCPAGEYIVGFTAGGFIDCQTPPLP